MKKIAPFPEYVELQENKGDIYRDFSETILTFRDAICIYRRSATTRTKPSGLSTNGPSYWRHCYEHKTENS